MRKEEELLKAADTVKGAKVIHNCAQFIINNVFFEWAPNNEEMVSRILKKEPEERTLFDLRKLHKHLGKIEFFEKYILEGRSDVPHQCYRELTY